MAKGEGMNKRGGRPMVLSGAQASVPTESQAMLDWGEEAGLLVKRRMIALGWGYAELADALATRGIKRSAVVINRRINRGNFSAGFLLACLDVMQVELMPRSKRR